MSDRGRRGRKPQRVNYPTWCENEEGRRRRRCPTVLDVTLLPRLRVCVFHSDRAWVQPWEQRTPMRALKTFSGKRPKMQNAPWKVSVINLCGLQGRPICKSTDCSASCTVFLIHSISTQYQVPVFGLNKTIFVLLYLFNQTRREIIY